MNSSDMDRHESMELDTITTILSRNKISEKGEFPSNRGGNAHLEYLEADLTNEATVKSPEKGWGSDTQESDSSSDRTASRRSTSPKDEQQPAICNEAGCSSRLFSGRANLLRHRREVHGLSQVYKQPPSYPCPIVSCTRHINAFPRKYNLQQHMKKCHSRTSPYTPTSPVIRDASHVAIPRPCSRGRESGPPFPPGGNNIICIVKMLEAKMHDLQGQKSGLDDQIKALSSLIQNFASPDTASN